MADFDPDKYLAQAKPAFDPDQYLAQAKPKNAAESALMHGLQGATAGFLDELSGLGEAAGRAVGIDGIGGSFSDVKRNIDGGTLDMEKLKAAYRAGRDKKRALLDAQRKENPAASNIGEFTGMVVSPINKLTKGLSAAKSAAVLGGLSGLGSSKAEDAGGMLVDTAVGTALGGAIGKGAEKASPYIERGARKVGQKLGEGAKAMAARAIGAERGTIKSLGYDKVKQAGAQALDEGLLSLRDSTDDMIAKNQALKSKGGKLMEKAYQAIDDAGASTFNPLEVAVKVEEKLGKFYRSPINKGETTQLENTLESMLMRGDKNISLKEAQALKEELGSVANWKNNINISDKEKMAREAYRIVSNEIDNAVERGSAAIKEAGLGDVLSKGKSIFSRASTTEKLLENKLAREQGNKFIGLTDAITGAGALGYGGTTGDWETAGGVVVGKKLLQRYGAKAAARALNRTSKILLRSPSVESLAQKSPAAFHELNQRIAEKLPNFFKAADNTEPKGPDKWVVDGFSKLDGDILENPKSVDILLDSKEGRNLLTLASDLKPGSAALKKHNEKIKAFIKGGS